MRTWKKGFKCIVDSREGPLVPQDVELLAECESTIEAWKAHWPKVSRALWEINAKRLYRSTDDSFGAYCVRRWGFNKSWGIKLIRAGSVLRQFSTLTEQERNGSSRNHLLPILTSVNASYELSKVSEPERLTIVEGLSKSENVLTDKAVREAVAKYTGKTSKSDGNGKADAATEQPARRLPEPVQAALDAAKRFESVALTISKAAGELQKLAAEPYGHYLDHAQPWDTLKRMAGMIRQARPYAECHHCKAQGCGACGNRGWLKKVDAT